MNKQKVVIVIPIHSNSPSHYELISFKQCFTILGKHPIRVLAPENIKLDAYKQIVPFFDVILINPSWQSSILNYNKLKLSKFFYSLFDEYEYLLTYELDAFVFKDELLEWCNKGYDYIGAPWFKDYINSSNEIIGVGNSGFSLRKIKTIQTALNKNYFKELHINVKFPKSKLAGIKRFIYNISNFFGETENLAIQRFNGCFMHETNYYSLNEDFFISHIMSRKVETFSISPIYDAISFSFETNPTLLFKMNNFKLPMGCHAWWRYDLKFWKPYIENFNYTLDK
jgi:hypothetical protein